MPALIASRFNIEVLHPDTRDTILYNSLYGSVTAWDSSEIPAVRAVLDAPDTAGPAQNAIVATLREQKHLVTVDTDEIAMVEGRKRLGVLDQNRLDVILMPTLDCNFACSYCYETRQASRMSPAIEAAVTAWLEAQIPRYKLTLLHWFGGEPLIAQDQVARISARALAAAKTAHAQCAIHVTTNGYLLTPNRLPDLLDAGIRDFQVTLDGPAETHDRLRVLRNGGGTFQRIFTNVVALARADERVRVSLRVNFNHTNLDLVPALLQAFPSDVRPRLRPVLEPIFGSCSLSATDNLPASEISELMASHYRMAAELGYWVPPGTAGTTPGKLVYCYAERENQVVINFNGDVFKCTVCDFRPEERVGHLESGGILVKDKEKWPEWVSESNLFDEQCYSCKYLPLCMGGCRKSRLQGTGTGSFCTLVPTNASYVLKQVAFGSFGQVLHAAHDRANPTSDTAAAAGRMRPGGAEVEP